MEFCLAQLEVPCIIHSWRRSPPRPPSSPLSLSLPPFFAFLSPLSSLSILSLPLSSIHIGGCTVPLLRNAQNSKTTAAKRRKSRVRFMNFNEISSPRWRFVRVPSRLPPFFPLSLFYPPAPLSLARVRRYEHLPRSMYRPVNGVHIASPRKQEVGSRGSRRRGIEIYFGYVIFEFKLVLRRE